MNGQPASGVSNGSPLSGRHLSGRQFRVAGWGDEAPGVPPTQVPSCYPNPRARSGRGWRIPGSGLHLPLTD